MLSIITIVEIAKEVAKMLAKEIVIFGDRLPYKKQQQKNKKSALKNIFFFIFFLLKCLQYSTRNSNLYERCHCLSPRSNYLVDWRLG